MNDSSGSEQFPRRLLEKEARRILDRALELDHVNGPHMSMENLRTIARELGISDEALNTAMHETLQAPAASGARSVPAPDDYHSAGEESWFSRWWGGRREKWSTRLQWLTKLSLPIGLATGVVIAKSGQDHIIDRDGAVLFLLFLAFVWGGLLSWRPSRSTAAQIVSLSFLFWLGLFFGGNLTGWFVFGSGRMIEFISVLTAMSFGLSLAVGVCVTLVVALVKQFMPRDSTSTHASARSDALDHFAVTTR